MMFLLLLLTLIEVPEWARIPNSGSNCLWASLNTLAKMHNIKELDQLLLDRLVHYQFKGFKGAVDDEVKGYLDSVGANYILLPQKDKDTTLLEKYGNDYGVVVSFKPGWKPGWTCHAVLVTTYTQDTVKFWDPNARSKSPDGLWKCNRAWFDAWWTGGSVVILPKEKSSDQTKAEQTQSNP